MAKAHQILSAFDELLQPVRFKDDGPNGFQVAEHMAGNFGIEHRYIEIDNPA
ncbi:MAG: hypothetical protein ABIU58_09765 [Ramlibacter sp.]